MGMNLPFTWVAVPLSGAADVLVVETTMGIVLNVGMALRDLVEKFR